MQSRVLDWYKGALGESWFNVLEDFLISDEMENIRTSTLEQRRIKPVFPAADSLFRAFSSTPFEKVRVVILGQDPYHTPGYATGLAFASGKEYPLPPSLRNILKEVEQDAYNGLDLNNPMKIGLEHWAEQGILLLNTALTVPQGEPGAHASLWMPFTKEVINLLQERGNVIFILWGKYAQAFKPLIDTTKNFVLEAAHPSPFSARNGFFGCKHFTTVNEILKTKLNDSNFINW